MSFLPPFRSRPEPDLRVLMVCLGNICRSPMAEGILRAKLGRSDLAKRVLVGSAGTLGHAGSPVDARAAAAAAQRGYDLSGIRSRRIADADFERFDLLVAMDEDNLAELNDRCPPPLRDRLALLLDLAPRTDGLREVPDPYYGAAAGFERVLDLLEPACDALVALIRGRLDSGR